MAGRRHFLREGIRTAAVIAGKTVAYVREAVQTALSDQKTQTDDRRK